VALTELALWLKADAGRGGGAISTWLDDSGKGNHAVQTLTANRPQAIDAVFNGRPIIRFDGINDLFNLPNFLNSATQAEAFVISKGIDAPGSNRSLWRFGGSGSGSLTFPATDLTVSEDFGSTTIKALGDPAQALDEFHLFGVSARPNDWSARFNGVLQMSTTNNTVGFWNPPTLGGGPSFFTGDIAEVLIYNRALSEAERDAVGRYLAGKYTWIAAPATPTNLTARAISSNQVSLTWGAPIGNSKISFQVERKQGSGGTYSVVALVDQSDSYIDTGLTPGTQYFYQIKAITYGGESGYATETNATPAPAEANWILS